jgi:hypothetical protein
MRTKGIGKLLLVSIWALGACGGDAGSDADEGAAADNAAQPAPSGIESTVGAAGRAQNTVMIAEMRSHLNVLQAAGGDEMVAMVSEHRQRVENLISQLDAQHAADARWTALADSVRQDLGRMQGMPALELEVLIDANVDRVRRLIEMHEQMGRGAQPR